MSDRRWRTLLGGVLAVVTALAFALGGGPLVVPGLLLVADGDFVPPDTTLSVAAAGSDGAYADRNQNARMSEDGRYTVFSSYDALEVSASLTGSAPVGGSEASTLMLYVHDRVTGRTTLLSDPYLNAQDPTISGTGRYVTYVSDSNQVILVDRQATGKGDFDAKGNLVARPLTGTTRDLHFQRAGPRCSVGDYVEPRCGPKISADGRTVAYAAQFDPIPLRLGISLGPTTTYDDTLDLTPSSATGYGTYPTGFSSATVSYQNFSGDPLPFAVSLVEPATRITGLEAFTQTNTCPATLDPGAGCAVTVVFQGDFCDQFQDLSATGHFVTGALVTSSTLTTGQSRLGLNAFCYTPTTYTYYDTVTPSTPPPLPSCPAAPKGLALEEAQFSGLLNNQNTALLAQGGTEIGRPYVVHETVDARDVFSAVNDEAQFRFLPGDDSDCGVQLVDPTTLDLADPLPADAPPPCVDGMALLVPPFNGPAAQVRAAPKAADAPPFSCTAYLLIRPTDLTESQAFLGYEYVPPGYVTTSRFEAVNQVTTRGVRSVVLVRHTDGGRLDRAGVQVVGTEDDPTVRRRIGVLGRAQPYQHDVEVSGDGRSVVYQARSQLWVRRFADDGQLGPPGLVSCLPATKRVACPLGVFAASPDLSDNGNVLVFGIDGRTAASSQVYRRVLTRNATALVSRAADGTPGDSTSYVPSVSGDGRTVAFLSSATNFTTPAIDAERSGVNVYVRGFGDAEEPTGLALAQPLLYKDVTQVDVDEHGRFLSFTSQFPLDPGDPAADNPYPVWRIYQLERQPRYVVTPATADLGSVPIGGSRPLEFTVTNAGAGPGLLAALQTTSHLSVVSTTCVGTLLFAGRTCTVNALYRAPRSPGPSNDALTLVGDVDGNDVPSTPVAVSAEVPEPALLVQPTVVMPGQVVRVTGTNFPAGSNVRLTWSRGIGSRTVSIGDNGRLSTELVIYQGDETGTRNVVATVGSRTLNASVLVQPRGQQPPFRTNS